VEGVDEKWHEASCGQIVVECTKGTKARRRGETEVMCGVTYTAPITVPAQFIRPTAIQTERGRVSSMHVSMAG
jgi:hypothetical protein